MTTESRLTRRCEFSRPRLFSEGALSRDQIVNKVVVLMSNDSLVQPPL